MNRSTQVVEHVGIRNILTARRKCLNVRFDVLVAAITTIVLWEGHEVA
jgi:hypothetical protein